MNFKKTALSAAVVASLVGVIAPAQAANLTFDWTGTFTMLNSLGQYVANSDFASVSPYYGNRTPITGTMTFDTVTGAGTGTVGAFNFFGAGPAVAHSITMQSIGDGMGGPGTLVFGSMLFDWNSNNNISVQVVLDAAGLFAALPTLANGGTVNQTSCAAVGSGCAVAASDGVNAGTAKKPVYYSMGALPVAMTTYNVNNAGTAIGGGTYTTSTGVVTYGSNDAIGGTFMDNGPFVGFNANFDMLSVTLTGCTDCNPNPVPVPAAVWLFGSGLLGLAGIARRRKA